MGVVFGLHNLSNVESETAVAVGVFDGVHWGHRAIFDRLRDAAASKGLTSVALTFDRHPAELLAPSRAPEYVTTLSQRTELILECGVDLVVVAEFDSRLASLGREDFVRQVLLETLRARQVVVGSNFVFGKDRAGDVRYLEAQGRLSGFQVSVVPSVIIDGAPASSTRIRGFLKSGDVEAAARLLGRRFVLRGRVVRGSGVGRQLGFPTANLETEPRQALPGFGVYVVETGIDGAVYTGVCSVGTRPTFGGANAVVEVYLMSYDGNLYGRTLDVGFVRRLRGQMVFDNSEGLVEQIKKDVAAAMEKLPQRDGRK